MKTWQENFWDKFKRNSLKDSFPKHIEDPILLDTIIDEVQSLLDEQKQEHEKQLREIREKYQELIVEVHNKYEGETRHQTALRYIKGY